MCPSPPLLPRRSSLRRKSFDDSTAAVYFLTICTSERKTSLGVVCEGTLRRSAMGCIVLECWFELAYHYARLELAAFVVMPNHVHGLISWCDPVGAGLRPALSAAAFPCENSHSANPGSPNATSHTL